RSDRDWSSDVCSSDLPTGFRDLDRLFQCLHEREPRVGFTYARGELRRFAAAQEDPAIAPGRDEFRVVLVRRDVGDSTERFQKREIGRASCRERVEVAV